MITLGKDYRKLAFVTVIFIGILIGIYFHKVNVIVKIA